MLVAELGLEHSDKKAEGGEQVDLVPRLRAFVLSVSCGAVAG
jgi:hypothetical protein